MRPYYDDDRPLPPPYAPGYGQYYGGGAPRRVVYLPPPAPRPYHGPRTSSREIFDLTLAVAVLTLIFGMPYGGVAVLMRLPAVDIAFLFGTALLAVVFAILSHELMHKYVAQKYGCWAEFRRSDMWLVMGVLLSLSGFAFIAAPGAVMIAGPVTRESNGKISAAGPGTNAVVAMLFFPLAIFTGGPTNILGAVFSQIVVVSTMLGIFNMLPIMPFDGSKVWKWNAGAYLGLLGLLVAIAIGAYFKGIFFA